MTAWGITDRGVVRGENQDVFRVYCDSEKKTAVLLVCDGMGGANAGSVASDAAAETYVEYLIPRLERRDVLEVMTQALDEANARVYDAALFDERFEGMGTTLVAAVVRDGVASFLNVGDSRAYHVSGGHIELVTRDHSLVQEMVELGDITPEEAETHPKKNIITRAVGTSPNVTGDTYTRPVGGGDYILLCSDGVSNVIREQELLDFVINSDEPEDVAKAIIGTTLDRGAPDNATVLVLKV